MPPLSPIIVHKFGGAALADADAIARVVAIVGAHTATPRVVVVSAMQGVTDALLQAARQASEGALEPALAGAERLRAQHAEAAAALLRGDARREARAAIDASIDELSALLRDCAAERAVDPDRLDEVVARGERLSA
ncbi:MAG TPA: hypothetical protein VEA99_12255, partial [Gemmatimonadaceae bacterium]|nr:hypothetical protein [Gemmatimonadaceae bacterium]